MEEKTVERTARSVALTALTAGGLAVVSVTAGVPGVAAATDSASSSAWASAATGAKRAVATGSGGAVASVDANASQAGIDVLRHGGNAIDAAVAVATTLGVTEPFVAGPGGGGYMVIYLAKQHRVVTIDGRETCPATCTPQRFVNSQTGKAMVFETARHSGISVGVPGQPATWERAVDLYGRESLATDLQPAIARARAGFRVDPAFRWETASSLADLRAFPASRKLFLTKNGQPLPLGYVLHNPDLAKTYEILAKDGTKAFYDGEIGSAVVNTVDHPAAKKASGTQVIPGSMTMRDLGNYTAKVQAPTSVKYRGYQIDSMAPSSSGGSTVGEALSILSQFKLSAGDRAGVDFHYLEASRLAFADRNAYVGDQAFVSVPLKTLLSKKYTATRACLITDRALMSPAAPGNPYGPLTGCATTGTPAPTTHEGTQTNHLVVADRWGNVVSYTNTIEQLAGSGMTVPGYGFLLNNEMTDFDFTPTTPGLYDPNLPAPGKRPRSSMSPTIVLKNGRPVFAVGSPGGSTIITTVLQILVNRIDLGMSLPKAIDAPRASQRNLATTDAEPLFYSGALRTGLQNRYGEVFDKLTGVPGNPIDQWLGDAAGVTLLPGNRFQAAAEPVRVGGGSAMVVNAG